MKSITIAVLNFISLTISVLTLTIFALQIVLDRGQYQLTTASLVCFDIAGFCIITHVLANLLKKLA